MHSTERFTLIPRYLSSYYSVAQFVKQVVSPTEPLCIDLPITAMNFGVSCRIPFVPPCAPCTITAFSAAPVTMMGLYIRSLPRETQPFNNVITAAIIEVICTVYIRPKFDDVCCPQLY
jgi:hypothetical protein